MQKNKNQQRAKILSIIILMGIMFFFFSTLEVTSLVDTIADFVEFLIKRLFPSLLMIMLIIAGFLIILGSKYGIKILTITIFIGLVVSVLVHILSL